MEWTKKDLYNLLMRTRTENNGCVLYQMGVVCEKCPFVNVDLVHCDLALAIIAGRKNED